MASGSATIMGAQRRVRGIGGGRNVDGRGAPGQRKRGGRRHGEDGRGAPSSGRSAEPKVSS